MQYDTYSDFLIALSQHCRQNHSQIMYSGNDLQVLYEEWLRRVIMHNNRSVDFITHYSGSETFKYNKITETSSEEDQYLYRIGAE